MSDTRALLRELGRDLNPHQRRNMNEFLQTEAGQKVLNEIKSTGGGGNNESPGDKTGGGGGN